MVLKDTQCYDCGYVSEQVMNGSDSCVICDNCGGNARVVFLKAPMLGEMETDFRPHYDMSLGEHFHTSDEKKSFLKQTGRDQSYGSESPQSDTPLRKQCTKTQAHKVWGKTDHSTRIAETKQDK